MKYLPRNLDNLVQIFEKFSVIILHGKNEGNLHNDFLKLVNEIGGPSVKEEMRISTFLDSEIKEKTEEIFFKIKSKGFFKGPNLVLIKNLTEKNEKIVVDIDKMWLHEDSLTLVCIEKLSMKSQLKSLAEKSSRIAYLRYYDSSLDRKQLLDLFAEKNLTLKDKNALNTIYDLIQNSPRSEILETLEKLSLLKLNDNTPIVFEDFISVAFLGYETGDLDFAFAIADGNLREIYKNLRLIQITGKRPENLIQFLNLYFRKLYLIEIYGESSSQAKREFPFLFGRDLQMAKKFAKNWGKKNLKEAINFLTATDYDLRKNDPALSFMLFSKHILKMGSI